MTDLNTALRNIAPSGDANPSSSSDAERLRRLEALQSPLARIAPEKREEFIKKAIQETTTRQALVDRLRRKFRELVSDHQALPFDSLQAREIRNNLGSFVFEEQDPFYKATARAALALGLIEYTLENRPDVSLRTVRTLFRGESTGQTREPSSKKLRFIISELLLVEDAQGTIKHFGKRYRLPKALAESSVAADAVAKLRALADKAAANDQLRARKGIANWSATTTVSLAQLAAGTLGRARGDVLEESGTEGPSRRGGVIFWDRTPEGVFIRSAFGRVSDYIADHELKEVVVPQELLVAEKLPGTVGPAERRRALNRIRGLFAQALAAAARTTEKHSAGH